MTGRRTAADGNKTCTCERENGRRQVDEKKGRRHSLCDFSVSVKSAQEAATKLRVQYAVSAYHGLPLLGGTGDSAAELQGPRRHAVHFLGEAHPLLPEQRHTKREAERANSLDTATDLVG